MIKESIMNKKFLTASVFIVTTILASSAALAIGPLGPPAAGLNQGQFGVAAEYDYRNTDLTIRGNGLNDTLDNVKSNTFLAQPAYGLTDNWEIYALLGVADAKFEDFDSGYKFAYGLGTKVTFMKQTDLSLGALFEIGWSSSRDSGTVDLTDLTGGGFGLTDYEIKIDYYEITVAVGPTWKMAEGLRLYGGPFLNIIDGSLKLEALGTDASFDLKEKSPLGGYIGAQWDICTNTSWYAEFQFTGASTSLGTGVNWKF
jgi:opacity protein-like surface antigen